MSLHRIAARILHAKHVGRQRIQRQLVLVCGECRLGFLWSAKGQNKYCSRECVGRAVGKLSVSRGRLRHYACEQCAKPFSNYYDNRRFCSSVCAGEYRRSAVGVGRCATHDANHAEIVGLFRSIGAGVVDTSRLGCGFPDLIVALDWRTELVEIKNPRTPYGRKGLSGRQEVFAAQWPTPVHIARNKADVYKVFHLGWRRPKHRYVDPVINGPREW